MNGKIGAALAASAVLIAGAAQPAPKNEDCRTVRILSDGSTTESRADKGAATGSAQAAGRRSSSASSSVSVSASSDGRSSSRSSSATEVDGKGRRITTTHDGDSCTVTIDERGQGD